MNRLRSRVTLAAFAISLIVLSVAAFAMYRYQHRLLLAAVDATLEESIYNVLSEFNMSRHDADGDQAADDEAFRQSIPESERSLQLIDADGKVLAASGLLSGQPAMVSRADIVADTNATVDKVDTMDGYGDDFRIAVSVIKGDHVLVSAYSLNDVSANLEAQRRLLFAGIPLLAALVGLLTWLVLGRALEPVEAIRREVAHISGQALDRRVPVPDRSTEIAALATTMNDMLDRLDESATAQRQFVSDAAHELRSPLAGLRAQLEVALRYPDATDRRSSDEEMLREAVRLQNLVDGLLALARLRAANDEAEPAPKSLIDLDDIVFHEADHLRRSTTLMIRTDGVSAAQVHCDGGQLRRVLRNLSDNAARHARSTISFELAENDDHVRFSIADDGPGIAEDKADAVFDRFTRLDEARDRDSGGSGLGLAICREVIESHDGTIVVESADMGGARFVVTLPL